MPKSGSQTKHQEQTQSLYIQMALQHLWLRSLWAQGNKLQVASLEDMCRFNMRSFAIVMLLCLWVSVSIDTLLGEQTALSKSGTPAMLSRELFACQLCPLCKMHTLHNRGFLEVNPKCRQEAVFCHSATGFSRECRHGVGQGSYWWVSKKNS